MRLEIVLDLQILKTILIQSQISNDYSIQLRKQFKNFNYIIASIQSYTILVINKSDHIIIDLKLMAREIFKTDKKFWTQSQCDEIEVFFYSNSFFSKLYEHNNFNEVVGMTFYTRLYKNSPLFLENNKKSEAIVLLSGKIDIYKKFYRDKNKKSKTKKNNPIEISHNQDQETYQFYTTLTQQNQSVVVGSDCKIVAENGSECEILFVPWIMYNDYVKNAQSSKADIIFRGLRIFFPSIQRKPLMVLARQGCYCKELNIHDLIYHAGSTPQEVYLLMQGNIKLQKPAKTSGRKMLDIVIVESPSMFGQKDIKLLHRLQSAVISSASARIIAIPKKQFLRFAREFLPDITYLKEEQKQLILPLLGRNKNSLSIFEQKKVKFKRFHSSEKIENQKSMETKIIKNCHLLVNLSPDKSRTERFQGKTDELKDYSRDQFQEKIRLFNKIRPDARVVGFQNPLIHLTPKKNITMRNQYTSYHD